MLFKTRFHPGIADGSITRTFRAWKTPRVSVGKRYRIGSIGSIEVESVDAVSIGSLRDADAKRAGFSSKAELVEFLCAGSRTRVGARAGLDSRSKVFRVVFHHVGQVADPRVALRARTSAAAVDEARARLERMDARSPRGPWTRQVLKLIGDKPHTAASKLAPRLGRETLPFKTDVRKLKALGLTISHEVGYELSPLGRAVMAKRK